MVLTSHPKGYILMCGRKKLERVLHCWEYMRCGREPGGTHADELGICAAAIDERFAGRHRGINAGRPCWVVAGTVSKGSMHGSFASNSKGCGECDFYKLVRKEEGDNLHPTVCLLGILDRHK